MCAISYMVGEVQRPLMLSSEEEGRLCVRNHSFSRTVTDGCRKYTKKRVDTCLIFCSVLCEFVSVCLRVSFLCVCPCIYVCVRLIRLGVVFACYRRACNWHH